MSFRCLNILSTPVMLLEAFDKHLVINIVRFYVNNWGHGPSTFNLTKGLLFCDISWLNSEILDFFNSAMKKSV